MSNPVGPHLICPCGCGFRVIILTIEDDGTVVGIIDKESPQ